MSSCSMQGPLNRTSLIALTKDLLDPICGKKVHYNVFNMPCDVKDATFFDCNANNCNQCMPTCLANNREAIREMGGIKNQARVDLKSQQKSFKKKVVQKRSQSKTQLKRLDKLKPQVPKNKKQYR